jgi:hypothetical protein
MERNFLRLIRMNLSVAVAGSAVAPCAMPFPRPFDADAISHAISDLLATRGKVVRLLPFGVSRMSTLKHAARWDYRVICDCQEHARRERTLWRRSLRLARRGAKQLGNGGMALLFGVPVAFGLLGFPSIEAMSINKLTIPEIMSRASMMATRQAAPTQALPIFTTAKVRAEFLGPRDAQRTFTIDTAKEEFFRAHVPYGTFIYREARRYGLPPELVAAVVEAESDFRPRLVSEKNAQGLMQIVPETGRLMGTSDLFNPEKNVAAGTKYLHYLMNRFGDQRIALAAYNAGEGNVERFGGVPPFPETLNYLQRVSRRTDEYRQKVNGTFVATVRLRATQPQ